MKIVQDWVSIWAGKDLVALVADPERLEQMLQALHPEFTGRWVDSLPDVETFRGIDGARRMTFEWLESWDEYRQDPLEFIDAGDAVVVPYRQVGSGKGSGAEVESEITHVYTLREGKILSLREYPSRAEALQAAALEE